MKKVLALTLASLALAACSSTWHGMKEDTSENVEKTGDGIERGLLAFGLRSGFFPKIPP